MPTVRPTPRRAQRLDQPDQVPLRQVVVIAVVVAIMALLWRHPEAVNPSAVALALYTVLERLIAE